MALDEQDAEMPSAKELWFTTTHWSVVLAASQHESPEAAAALEQLCRAYWYPLYAYVRRKGHSAEDAQDLTQSFFARLLSGNYLSVADRKRGRFRSFLLGSLEHYLAREWTRAHAQKRGRGRPAFSLEELAPEERYRLEPAHEWTPERIFHRRWATTLLERALTALKRDFEARGQGEVFARLEGFLSGDGRGTPYAEIATSLEMTEGALKVAVHRLRKRYGELIREEIAQTVATTAEAEEELRYLFAVLRE